jgi:GNAT superfamily N-acetyltransferase
MSGARFDITEKAEADDAGLADLLIEMQAHYGGLAPPRDVIVSDLRALPAGTRALVARMMRRRHAQEASLPAGTRALVAREASRIVGFAFFAAQYPGPGLRRGLYLKELYVAAACRGRGAGGALMAALLDLARREGHARLDFTAAQDDAAQDDAALMAFYARFGAKRTADRSFFRLTLDAPKG